MGASKGLQVVSDLRSTPLPALDDSTYINHRVLAASTAETETKPAGARYALVTAFVDCFIAKTGTAAVPAADVTDGTGVIPVLSGSPRLLNLVDQATVSVISASAGIVSFEYYW